MGNNPYANRYCPICLGSVDAKNGDHWSPCEYEAATGDWINPQQPLTELEMLQQKVDKITEARKFIGKMYREANKDLIETRLRLKSLESGKSPV